MKNFLMIIVLLSGFTISSLNAQSCHPCPPCPACPQGCCMSGGNKASAASFQIVPATLDLTGNCTPQAMTTCLEGQKMSAKDAKACQATCTKGSMPACQPAAAKTALSSTAVVDEKIQQVPTPQKG